MKRCPRCASTKSLAQFHLNRARKDGHQSICKSCRAELDRERYVRSHKADRRERRHELLRVRTEWLRSLKEGRPCHDCGKVFPPEAMQWDHLPGRPKRGHVSELRGLSKEEVLSEIVNCELVCTNCHTLRTFDRAGWRVREPAGGYGAVA